MINQIKQKHSSLFSNLSWILCFFLVFVSLFVLSGQNIPRVNLDTSWEIVLEYAFEHGFQFGSNINFTYGPLGFLSTFASQGHLTSYRIVFSILQAGITAGAITEFARRISSPVKYIFVLWLMIVGFDEEYWLLIIAYTAVILMGDLRKHRITSILLIFFVAILSLIKFTFFLASAFTIIVCIAYQIAKKKMPEAVSIGAWFCCSILILWTVSYQEINNIVPWMKSSFELTKGFTDAMAFMPNIKIFYFSITAGMFFIAGFILIFIKLKFKNIENFLFIMLLIVYVFLAWKHGFVRADDVHVFHFINFLPLAFALLFVDTIQTDVTKKIRHCLTALYIASITLCTVAANVQSTDTMYNKLIKWPFHTYDNLGLIAKVISGENNKIFAALNPDRGWKEKFILTNAAKIIGNEPVDVVNFLQWPAIATGLTYSPRPVFQGYLAYTPYLQNLNLEFFRSKRPPYIVLNMETFNDRFPTLDDAASIPYIFNNYLPVGKDAIYLILKRKSGDNNYSLKLVHEEILDFGENLDLSEWNKEPIFLQVTVKPSILGRIQKILFQPFPIAIVTNSTKDISHHYLFIPRMAEQGFMLSPIIKTNNDLIDFFKGESKNIVKSIHFEAYYNFNKRSDVFNIKVYRSGNFPSHL